MTRFDLWVAQTGAFHQTMITVAIPIITGLVWWALYMRENPKRRQLAVTAWWALVLGLLGVGPWLV